MVTNEMEAGTRDQGGQALEEFERCHDDMRGAIAVGSGNAVQSNSCLKACMIKLTSLRPR